MEFNPQLAIGKHAQVVEVECRRSYEGKGAYPDYSKVALLSSNHTLILSSLVLQATPNFSLNTKDLVVAWGQG